MKKIAVLTSGGDSPGMNAAIRSVVRCSLFNGFEVFGIQNGYEGLLNEEFFEMKNESVGDILHRGGTILGTSRSDRFKEEKWQAKAAEILKKREIDALIVIGGDGTFRGGACLSRLGVNVVGIPASIDNDQGYTDRTIGFSTAVNTVTGLISNVRDTSSSHERTTVIEVMGRKCGDIALFSGLSGGADVILVPERPVNISVILKRVRQGQSSGKKHSIIVMAEGCGYPVNELCQLLENLTGRETRSVVPGYIQRGGSPTAEDRILASRLGEEAVRLIKNKESLSAAVGIKDGKVINIALEDAGKEDHFREDLYELSLVIS